MRLPSSDGAVCFSFVVFLYGAHVAKVSVHSYQTTSGKPHTSELYHAVGAKGLSWVPVSVSVKKSSLGDPNKPFLLVVRATKGSGPEADIAFDHVSISSGACHQETNLDVGILLTPALDPASTSVHFLKGGSASTRYIQEKGLSMLSTKGELERKNVTISTDSCQLFESCSECLTSKAAKCAWCETSMSCGGESSSPIKICSPYRTLHHNTSKAVQSGISWCPRMVAGEDSRMFVPVHSSPSLTFAVTNIQATDTNLEWTCAYSIEAPLQNINKSGTNEEVAARTPDAPFLNEELRLLQILTENYKDESLWLQLKGLATGQDPELAKTPTTIKVPGRFQGTIIGTGGQEEQSGIGVGAIRCESSDTLFTSPQEKPQGKISVSLISPSGYVLDNPSNIHLVMYKCSDMGVDCESCVQMNERYRCGWCSLSKGCTTHENCKGGLWHAHKKDPQQVCSVQKELDVISDALQEDYDYKKTQRKPEEGDEQREQENDEENLELEYNERTVKGSKKKVKKDMKKFLGDMKSNEDRKQNRKKRGKNKSRYVKNDAKNAKLSKKTKSRGFLRVPTQEGVFVARDVWRLHTGRQYYIPVKKKTLVNLGFVRQITYGSLAGEKSRTILVDSSWKKAAGYYIDMYEKADQDPWTSIVTTNKEIFDKLISQLLPE